MRREYTIYTLVDEHGTRQYIGCTRNAQHREHVHRKRYPDLTFRSLECLVGAIRAFARERELIQRYRPLLNIANIDKPRQPRPRRRPSRPYRRPLTRAELDARLAAAAKQYWLEALWT